jgi:hypothetical protein
MLDLVFANLFDLKLVPADSRLAMPDTYHPPFIIYVLLPHVHNNLNSDISYIISLVGMYTLLYSLLSTHDWSREYETTSVDTAVANLNATVRGAMEQEIPSLVLPHLKALHRQEKLFSPSIIVPIHKTN